MVASELAQVVELIYPQWRPSNENEGSLICVQRVMWNQQLLPEESGSWSGLDSGLLGYAQVLNPHTCTWKLDPLPE